MSLDISVNRVLEDGTTEEIADMNWLRNPFGLERWAETNVGKELDARENKLWVVCNRWAYDEAENVDKKMFLSTVIAYWHKVRALEQGYFGFGLPGYQQFVQPNMASFPTEKVFLDRERIVGEKYDHDRYALLIPQEHFRPAVFHLPDPSLERYKAWFRELVDLAEALQADDAVLYCSN